MKRQGVVERVEEGSVTLVLADASCDGCSTPCGACNRSRKPQSITLYACMELSVGDRVELSCPPRAVVLYSLLLFALPIAVFVCLCLSLMQSMGEQTAALVSFGVASVVFLLGGALLCLPSLRRKNAFRITRVLARCKAEKELDKV